LLAAETKVVGPKPIPGLRDEKKDLVELIIPRRKRADGASFPLNEGIAKREKEKYTSVNYMRKKKSKSHYLESRVRTREKSTDYEPVIMGGAVHTFRMNSRHPPAGKNHLTIARRGLSRGKEKKKAHLNSATQKKPYEGQTNDRRPPNLPTKLAEIRLSITWWNPYKEF